jgi:hypothetical protein
MAQTFGMIAEFGQLKWQNRKRNRNYYKTT